jgi:hypothetical protein
MFIDSSKRCISGVHKPGAEQLILLNKKNLIEKILHRNTQLIPYRILLCFQYVHFLGKPVHILHYINRKTSVAGSLKYSFVIVVLSLDSIFTIK